MYECSIHPDYHKNLQNCHLQTVQSNIKGFSQRQIERAKAARELYHVIGTPSIANYKAIIQANTIKNCPVTIQDINLAERIFGPSISTMKGKSTRKTPPTTNNDYIEIPSELVANNRNIELCIDTLIINNCSFLTTIDRTI